MDASVDFEGDDAREAIMRAAAPFARDAVVRVTLTLRIQHEQKRCPQLCVIHAEGASEFAFGSDADAAKRIAELVDETYSAHYTYRGRIVGGRVLVRPALVAPIDPMGLRMRLAGTSTSLAVDARPHEWDRAAGTCVYDWIMRRYGRMRAVRKGGIGYLRGLMERGVDTVQFGVSTSELDAFAAAHGLRLFAATADGRVFHARTTGCAKYPAVAYAVVNGHMFPVTTKAEVFYMARHGRLRDSVQEPDRARDAVQHPAAVREDEVERALASARELVVDTDDLSAVWERLMRARNTTLNAGTRVRGATRLVRFAVDGTVVTANAGFGAVSEVAALLSVAARPSDGSGSLARRVFEREVPAFAHLAVNVQPSSLARGTPRTAFVGAMATTDVDPSRLRCFDVRRCYATQLETNGGMEWAVAGPFDRVEVYDGMPLTAGLYYVEGGAGHLLAPGSGWYYERWTARALRYGSRVTLQRRARRTLRHDVFGACVALVRASVDGDVAKLLVNSFIGGLRTTERKGGRCFATTEVSEARCIAGSDGVVRRLGEFLVAYTSAPRRSFAPDYSYLYDQVVEGGWVALDALCESVDRLVPGCVVAVKTDAVVVRDVGFRASELGDGVREELAPRMPTHALVARPDDVGCATELAWTPARGAPCLYIGMAGTGKTFGAREAAGEERLSGRRVVAVGPTVKAAANVGGMTLHALFGINQPECFSDPPSMRAIRRVARRYDCMLVDEVFMCSEWMMCALLLLRNAGMRMILAGDPSQLPPVGEMSVNPHVLARSALVHELVDGRVCALTDPRRTLLRDGLFETLRAFVEAPCSRASNGELVARFATCADRDVPERNLAYLNATCRRVNADLALRRKRGRAWLVCHSRGAEVCRGVWHLRRCLATHADAVVLPTGAPMLARSGAFGHARGSRVTLESLDAELGTATIGGATVGVLDVADAFELAFCVTIHRSQCETIDEPFAVHDARCLIRARAHVGKALLYVAVSRATRACLVRFVA
jgi:hypothetical protein